jgi:hypothetical protein
MAALGGASLLTGYFLSDGSKAQKVMHTAGLVLAIAGGALFVAGVTMVGIDAVIAPAPTPDLKGAQALLTLRL